MIGLWICRIHGGGDAQFGSVIASLGREQSIYDGEIPGGRPKQKLCPNKMILENEGAREASDTRNKYPTRITARKPDYASELLRPAISSVSRSSLMKYTIEFVEQVTCQKALLALTQSNLEKSSS